jgi:hypothetical protein
MHLCYRAATDKFTIRKPEDYLAHELVARQILKLDREFYPLFRNSRS